MVAAYFKILGQYSSQSTFFDVFLSEQIRLEFLIKISLITLSYNDLDSVTQVLQFLQYILSRVSEISQLPYCRDAYVSILKCLGNFFHHTTVQRAAALVLFIFSKYIDIIYHIYFILIQLFIIRTKSTK